MKQKTIEMVRKNQLKQKILITNVRGLNDTIYYLFSYSGSNSLPI